jgi:CRP/FNR family transcriptional regulator, cAMP and macrophage regulator
MHMLSRPGPAAPGQPQKSAMVATKAGMALHLSWLARDFGQPSIAPLAADDIEALEGLLQPVTFAAGRRILSPGSPADAAYIVRSGEVEIWLGSHRRGALLHVQSAGSVFADVPLLCDVPFPYTVVAKTDVTLLKLPREKLVQLLTQHPRIALRWLTSTVQRLEYANRRIAHLTAGNLRSRVLALLAGEVANRGGVAEIPLTQAEIAALLDAKRQSVNRVLAGLATEGYLRQQYACIEILNHSGLLQLAGSTAVIASC